MPAAAWTRPPARASSTRTRPRTASLPSPSAARSSRPDPAPEGALLTPRPAARRSGPAGDDGANRHLQRVTGARSLPLDLRVGLRDGAEGPRDALGLPPAQLMPHTVDLPWRGAD